MQTVLIDLQLGYFRNSNGKKGTLQNDRSTPLNQFQSHYYVFLKLYAEKFVMSKKTEMMETEKKSY